MGLGGTAPATPRLKEPMSFRKRLRYWALPGVVTGGFSVNISAPAGGETKSLLLIVHLVPPWQVWQPAWKNRRRPCTTSSTTRPPSLLPPPAVSSAVVSAPLGVRMPKRTHSLSASNADQAVPPGSV